MNGTSYPVDCDDVALLLASRSAPTVVEVAAIAHHAAGCETCRQLTTLSDEHFRWVVRIPVDAVDDRDLLGLPMVDPIVFETEAELARGGMGRITRAVDRRLGREVAIKEVLDPGLRARFEREALITASLQHPAIVPIYEAGTWPDGSAFYAMRLVSGGTLHDAIGRTRSLQDRLALLPHVRALTDALAYAHSRRIVHRDLKPGNVLVGEFGETVVIDWGLAKDLDGAAEVAAPERISLSSDLTRVGAVMGTPGFMSPEQALGAEVDERADVYALGAILYNVLAGHAPYADLDPQQAGPDAPTAAPVDKVAVAREQPPTPIGARSPEAPADLRAIVERAMARAAAERYPTAKEMAEELRRFEAGQLLRSREYGLRELLARWFRRHRTAVTISSIAFLIVVVVGIGAVIGIARSRSAERGARFIAERARETAVQAEWAAEKARAAADRDAVALLEEQGRDELLGGDRERALAYLSAAYTRGRDTVALRQLLAAATRDLELADRVIDPAGGTVTSIGFAGDGRAVTIDASDTGTSIALWDRDKPAESHPIDAAIERSRLSPDSRRAAVVTRDDRVAMYDTDSGKRLWSLADAKLVGPTIVFDPTGKRVAVLSGWNAGSAVAQVREVETGALVASLVAGSGAKSDVAFSPDGELVATGAGDGTVDVWDLRSGTRILTRRVQHAITVITFLGSGTIVAGTDEREAWIWRLAGGPPIPLTGHQGAITALAVNTFWWDMVAIGDSSGGVHLWNAQGELLGEAHDAQGAVEELTFSPDLALLLGGGADKRAYVWEIPSLALRRAITAYHGAPEDPRYRNAEHGLAWNRDGTRFATVGAGERRASLWHRPAGEQVSWYWSRASTVAGNTAIVADNQALIITALADGVERPHLSITPAFAPIAETLRGLGATWDDAVHDFVQTSRDGGRALIWGPQVAALYDLATGARLGEVPVTRPTVATLVPALSADGTVVLDVDPTGARLLDPTGHVVRRLAVAGAIDGAIAPDDDHLVLAFGDQPPRMWRLATGAEVPLHVQGGARHARFDRSGGRVVVYGAGAAVVIDATTGATLATLGGAGEAAIDDARFDGDGRRVATWARDHGAKLWDVATGAVLVAVEGVAWRGIAVSDDGARLATGSGDDAIQIWDAATARLLEILHGDRGLAGLIWSPDGTRLLAQSIGGHATIWDVHLEQRSPAEIAKIAAQRGWTVVDGLAIPPARP